MSLKSETLLAVTGIFPRDISEKQHMAAGTVAATFERRLKHFLGAEQQPMRYRPPPPNFERYLDRLVAPLDEAEVDAWFEGLGLDDVALLGEYTDGLTNARAYLAAVWPRVEVDDGTGPEIQPLAPDDAAEVWSLFRVLDDPESLLDDIDAWTLTPTQALAFRKNYPKLFNEAAVALERATSDRKARNSKWRPRWQQLAVIRTFKGMPPEDLPPPPPPAPAVDPKKAIDPEGAKTQGQVLDQPRAPDGAQSQR